MNPKKQIFYIFITMAVIMAFGVTGFMTIEGWSFLDSLYMSVITVSTVGYREVHPPSQAGMIFTIIFIIVGVGTFLYVITSTAEIIIAGHLKGEIGRNRMKKKINELKNHYIVCGFGRVGQLVAKELARSNAHFVVIDINADYIARCVEKGFLCILGSASDDEILKEAGIMRARGLVSAIDSDAENVYVTLSAKNLNSGIHVVARASSDEAGFKLLKARADRVLSPYSHGGKRLANLLLRPNVVEFLDVVMHSDEAQFCMEEIEVRAGSRLVGLSIGEMRHKCTAGANVLAVKKSGEHNKVIASPDAAMLIESGDMLITLGTREQLKQIEGLT